jgi:hypothetical protein
MGSLAPDRTIDELLIKLEVEIARAKWLASLCQENILAAQDNPFRAGCEPVRSLSDAGILGRIGQMANSRTLTAHPEG